MILEMKRKTRPKSVAEIVKSQTAAMQRAASRYSPEYLATCKAIDEWRDWNTDEDGNPLPPVGCRFNKMFRRWEFLSHGPFACTITSGEGVRKRARPMHRFVLNQIEDPKGALFSHRGTVHLSPVAACNTEPFIITLKRRALEEYNRVLTNDIL